MERAKRISRALRWCLLAGFFGLLCALWAAPAHAQNATDNYYYPNYDPAAHGEIDLMQYIKSITVTVNGQEYTPAELQQLQ